MSFDLLVRGGTLVSARGRERADLGIRAGKVVAAGAFGEHEAAEVLDARGLHV
ncbi:MAG: dihydroorotase, partial [Acidobacteria bacterium]|nr:dihydroorotase [Acidobacteriota bacterium]